MRCERVRITIEPRERLRQREVQPASHALEVRSRTGKHERYFTGHRRRRRRGVLQLRQQLSNTRRDNGAAGLRSTLMPASRKLIDRIVRVLRSQFTKLLRVIDEKQPCGAIDRRRYTTRRFGCLFERHLHTHAVGRCRRHGHLARTVRAIANPRPRRRRKRLVMQRQQRANRRHQSCRGAEAEFFIRACGRRHNLSHQPIDAVARALCISQALEHQRARTFAHHPLVTERSRGQHAANVTGEIDGAHHHAIDLVPLK